MAHDPHLADLMRSALRGRAGITEKKMFGGLCWLQHGNMLCGLAGDGRYMFRVGKAQEAAALAHPGARPMDFTGRPMGGFVWVDPNAALDAPLARWVDLAADYVCAMPPKAKPAKTSDPKPSRTSASRPAAKAGGAKPRARR